LVGFRGPGPDGEKRNKASARTHAGLVKRSGHKKKPVNDERTTMGGIMQTSSRVENRRESFRSIKVIRAFDR